MQVWQLPLPKDDAHFRLVILTPDAARSVKAADLQDPRLIVVYPAALNEEAFQAATNYVAWQNMNQDYRDAVGKEAETVREWGFEDIGEGQVWRGQVSGPDRLRFLGVLSRYAALLKGIHLEESGEVDVKKEKAHATHL